MSKKIPINSLIPDPANANKGTERGGYMLGESIAQTGLGRSIVIDKNGFIVAGNKTTEAAIAAGFEDAVIVETDGRQLVVVQRSDLDLTDQDPNNPARKLAYYDNRTGEVSLAWDAEQLLADINAGMDLGGLFFEDELSELLADIEGYNPQPEPSDAEPQTSRADELQAIWQVETGQMWRLPSRTEGQEHRIICGDCTDADVVERLGLFSLMLTDPPYGINVVSSSTSTDGASAEVTIGAIRGRQPDTVGGKKNMGRIGATHWVDATLYAPVIGDDKPYDPSYLLGFDCEKIIFGGNYFASKLPDSRCWVVWDKDNTGNFADAELAWTSFKTGVKLYKHTWNGLVREGERRLEGEKRMHPTQKPVGLFSRIIEDFSKEGDCVADFYHGSGVTLLACENTNRQCRAVEISPAYCAVALQRYKDAFGIEPELITD